jgi:hypothetical protein
MNNCGRDQPKKEFVIPTSGRDLQLHGDGDAGVPARAPRFSRKSFWVAQAFMPAFNYRHETGFSRRGKS